MTDKPTEPSRGITVGSLRALASPSIWRFKADAARLPEWSKTTAISMFGFAKQLDVSMAAQSWGGAGLKWAGMETNETANSSNTAVAAPALFSPPPVRKKPEPGCRAMG